MSSDLVHSEMRTRGTRDCAYCDDTSVIIRHFPSPFLTTASTLHTPSRKRERETDRIPSFLHSHFLFRPPSFSLPIHRSLIFSHRDVDARTYTKSGIQLHFRWERGTHPDRHRDTSRRKRKDRKTGKLCADVKKGESNKEK